MLPLKLRKFDIHHITCGRGGRKGAFPAFCQYGGGILSFNLCKWCEHSLKSELGLSYDTCHMTWSHHKDAPLKLVWSPPGSLLWFSSFWVDPWLSLLFVLVLGFVFQPATYLPSLFPPRQLRFSQSTNDADCRHPDALGALHCKVALIGVYTCPWCSLRGQSHIAESSAFYLGINHPTFHQRYDFDLTHHLQRMEHSQ